MSKIYLETRIDAGICKVFDLARDIGLHQKSTFRTGEKASAVRMSGLIEKGETVTWKAKHLDVVQTLTTQIISMERPHHFTDVMLKGAFRSMKHQHLFRQEGQQTVMTDVFEFESPLGIIGKVFNTFFLENYMKRFLLERNKFLKSTAELQDSAGNKI